MSSERSDLVVIGGGPTGLFSAYYAGLRGLNTVIVDTLPHLGGQVATLYPLKQIYDVAGFPAVAGGVLIDDLIKQLAPFPPRIRLEEKVTGLQRADGGSDWRVITDRQHVIHCAAVVISVGAGSFSPRRLSAVDDHVGRGAHYHGCGRHESTGQDVVIVGGGDSAVDCALDVVASAASVTLLHRTSRFRAHEYSLELLERSDVRTLTDVEVVAAHGDPTLTSLDIRHRTDGEVSTVAADLLVVALGFVTRLGPVADWGLELDGTKIVVDSRQQTSLPAVFAVGDIATYPGKVPLIATGFGEAATAVNNAAAVVLAGVDLDPGHSSDTHPLVGAPRLATAQSPA